MVNAYTAIDPVWIRTHLARAARRQRRGAVRHAVDQPLIADMPEQAGQALRRAYE